MERETKILLGKVLGEIYRIQKRIQSLPCPADDGQVYGLVNGFETAIDHELEVTGFISDEQVNTVADVLDPIFVDPRKLEEFGGFYDIESELKSRGIDRGTAATILTYFNIKGKFTSVIAKMDSSDSPTECRTFEPSDFDV